MLFVILMSFIVVGLSVSLAVGICCVNRSKKRSNYNMCSGGSFALTVASAIALAIALLALSGTLADQYSSSINIPLQIEALTLTISEQSALISSRDVGLGNGLEGLEIKKTIQQAIRDKNDLVAKAKYINKNSWILFKVEGY